MNSDKIKFVAILVVMAWTFFLGATLHELSHAFLNPNSSIWEICFVGWHSILGPAWIYIIDPINPSEILPLIVFLLTYIGIGAPLIWVIHKI